MTMPIEPLQRATFHAATLMAEHPPVLHDPNKKVVFGVACPPGSTHAGDLAYSRWPAFPLPAAISAADAVQRVVVHEGIYDYAPASGVEGGAEWHVNFADPRLFVSYGSGLFAQDEMQVAESSAVEGRPNGLYGNEFMMAKADVVRRATVRLEPPTISNVIAIAAPYGMSGRYLARDIEFALVTAYTGFRAAVQESDGRPAVVHTGYWGCGAFGGNRVLMSMLQVLAAELAGVERLVFHTVTTPGRAEFDQAMEKLRRELPGSAVNTPLALERIAGMGLRWGASDGN
jgi:Poly (ADP-ribose) glycohydrolase (PARG)